MIVKIQDLEKDMEISFLLGSPTNMVEITRASNSVSSMTNNKPQKINRYEEK